MLHLLNLNEIAMNILKYLNYQDMLSIEHTAKLAPKLRFDDLLLKRVIFEKTGLTIRKTFNVAKILFELNLSINDFIIDHFWCVPIYVDKLLFYSSQKNVLSSILAENLMQQGDIFECKRLILYHSYKFFAPVMSEYLDIHNGMNEIYREDCAALPMSDDLSNYLEKYSFISNNFTEQEESIKNLLFL